MKQYRGHPFLDTLSVITILTFPLGLLTTLTGAALAVCLESQPIYARIVQPWAQAGAISVALFPLSVMYTCYVLNGKRGRSFYPNGYPRLAN